MSKNRKNNHLMMMYYNASLNSNKRILDIFSTTQAATNVQIPLTLNIPNGKTVYIDWGDGSSLIECAGTGVNVTYKSNYTTVGYFNIKLLGDYKSVGGLELEPASSVITFTKGIRILKNLKSLTVFRLYNLPELTATGLISDFPRVTYLFNLTQLPNLTATGLISDFPRVTSYLILYNLPNITATGLISDFPRVTYYLNLFNLPNITATGLISDFPRVTSYLNLFKLPNITATGLISDFPRVTYYLILFNLPNITATGLISDFPRVTYLFNLTQLPNLTATGLISDFPRVTSLFNLTQLPNLTATGPISSMPALTRTDSTLTVINCPNVNLTIDTPPIWKNTTITLHVGWTTTQVNEFVKLWAQVTEDGGVKNVNIAGNNEPLTESDPDVAAALQILSDKNKILAYNI